MYLEAVGLAISTYKEGFERGGETIFIHIHSLTSKPSLIDIFVLFFYLSIHLFIAFTHRIDLLLPRKSSEYHTHPARRRYINHFRDYRLDGERPVSQE